MSIGRFTQRVTMGNAHQTQPFTLGWWALPTKNSLFGHRQSLTAMPTLPNTAGDG
ncbi:MAG: hypothetical protein AB4426_07230 [Xenococcaceae cyanobacterium]